MNEHMALRPQVAWRRPMVGRDPAEEHRSATVLELFFDLCFVVAVSQAAGGLHHALAEGHVADALIGYLMVFFAVWWAWMNFTWFSSAFDTDDVAYRVTVLVQIGGALVLAAGVPRALEGQDFGVVTLGYVIMRLALVTLWLRAAGSDPALRATSLRFAAGVTVVQIGWVLLLVAPGAYAAFFVLLALADVSVPVWAERNARTPWHPEHIAERYGLFTLIVLGESVLAATVAIQVALDDEAAITGLASLTVGAMLTVFSMWWLYFSKDAAGFLTSLRAGFVWGYGHYVIFGAAAAVGAGIAVNVDLVSEAAHLSQRAAAAALTIPVAVFVLATWVLQWMPQSMSQHLRQWRQHLLAPVAAGLVLLATLAPQPVLATGLVMAGFVVASLLVYRTPTGPPLSG